MNNQESNESALVQRQQPQQSLVQRGETSAVASAARAKALVEARYIMAMQHPRDPDVVRQKILQECKRPSFALNKSTYYVKPIGKGVEGLGIRFVEAAIRAMRNIDVDVSTTFEDSEKRILAVCVTDLEANVPYSADVTVTKTVERLSVPEGVTPISKRLNSYGKWTYLVPATDDDLLNKQNALVSKAMRTLGLRLVPGDVQDEARDLILAVRKDDAAKDPAATRKKLADAFMEFGISAEQLVEYLGHPLDKTTADELVTLRGLYGALDEEETTWAAIMQNRREQTGKPAGDAPPKAEPAAGTGSQQLKDKLKGADKAAPAAVSEPAGADVPPPDGTTAEKPKDPPAAAQAATTDSKPAASMPDVSASAEVWLAALHAAPEGRGRLDFMKAARKLLSGTANAKALEALESAFDDIVLQSGKKK